MEKKLLSGYYAALLTPFHDGGGINAGSLGALVDHVISTGLDGLYVGGSTGEAFLMQPEERKTLLRQTAEAAGGRTMLIAHVGDINQRLSLDLIETAVEAGYDAVSAVPPFYYGFSFAEIKAHYQALASASDLPFLVYNFPALSGVRFSTGQLAELMSLPNVVGVKNTCSDHYALERLRREMPDKTILNGFDETLLAGLALGADGGVGSTYNVQADKVLALASAYAKGNVERARGIQVQMNKLIDVLVTHGVNSSLKYLLELRGIPMGSCRAPIAPLGTEAKKALEAAAERLLGEPAEVEV
ncbi:N-acetylneuraminate lyase [Tropicimonas sp. IMCC6043]|uniref:N-acetylneuraminate lyase n=1 Tax=Tropicimonas sp. IMCC6043 TaxID=2510645 RepID=UPI00101DB9CC|nr:N-acetylneuraminate lyase [Tropicimonas sp. IMCC6043]RYH07872.1 N-acetylneuraminate lyase [Tropicimonas sp. IMCC6043]